MNILLVEPPYDLLSFNEGTIALFEPLGLETIAGMIPEAEIRLLDLRVEKNMHRRLGNFRPDVCAFACHSYATLPSTLRTIKLLRQMFPKALTVVGGHATLLPEAFAHPAVDAIVLGEGEETFRELVEAFIAGRDLAEVKGLALPNQGEQLLVTGKRERRRRIKGYPLPRRDLTAAYRRRYFRYDWRPMAAMVTSRGCPHRCDYCSIWKANEGRFRMRSPEDVVEEAATIKEPFITIVDDNFLADVGRVRRIIELLHARRIRKTFSIYARSDTISAHPELARELAGGGVKRVLLGLDGFRKQDLADRNKRNSVGNNERAVRILGQHDIQVLGYFLVRPDYTEKDFADLAAYVRQLNIFQPIFTMLTPLPGTQLYERVKSQLTTHDPRFYDFLHITLPTRLPLNTFYDCYTKLWRTSHKRSLLKLTPAAVRAYLVLRRLYRDHAAAKHYLPPGRPRNTAETKRATVTVEQVQANVSP